MRISIVLIVAYTFTFAAFAQPKTSTVHGEIVEVTSYVKDGIKPNSPAGREIAMGNIGKGGSLAIIEKGTGRVYVIAAVPSDSTYLSRVSAYLGTKAFIKGQVKIRSGVRVITVADIGKSLK